MSEPSNALAREPIDRAHRIIALGKAIEIVGETLEGETGHRADAVMAIRHSAQTINEEASGLVDQCEEAEAPHEQATIASRDVARVYDTLTLTQVLFAAAYCVAESRLEATGRARRRDLRDRGKVHGGGRKSRCADQAAGRLRRKGSNGEHDPLKRALRSRADRA